MTSLPPFLDLPPDVAPPRRPRSTRLAVLLTALFGPLGLFYSAPVGGLFMTFVCIIVGIGTVGVGLLFAWPVCILWAYIAASSQASPPEPGP